MKALIAMFSLIVGVAIGAALVSAPQPVAAPVAQATPCTKMHRQLIVIGRVNDDGEFVSTPVVVDVCDKATVAYAESK